MKAGYILALVIAAFAALCGMMGFYLQSQCTPLNEMFGNCADVTGYFEVAGVAFLIAVILAIVTAINETRLPPCL